ncbi:hypothetical protein ACFSQQ_37305 [Mesorhizobium kowhaii]|uniref:Uncharacterized protein n=2 Tax=Mesorhizobium TaxID=68287 RepID=A0ABW4W8N6_9HYPH|nr:hypothetical protein [Mesorhizobium sophorae]
MSANQQSPWERLDAAATDRLIERLLMGVGLAGIVAVVAVAVWLYSGVGFGHWFGYVVAVLVAAGLASIRIGGIGIGLLVTALAAFLFGVLGLIGGLIFTVLFLLARR